MEGRLGERGQIGFEVVEAPGQVIGLPDGVTAENSPYNPTTDVVLNPAAWTDQAAGVWGSFINYYGDFRSQRRPNESMNIGKRFPIRGERMAFSVRVEFFNVFNRLEGVPNPSTSNPQTAPTRNSAGVLTGGFGFVNFNSISTTDGTPRSGQVVVRFEF